jgi:hypothetical protein
MDRLRDINDDLIEMIISNASPTADFLSQCRQLQTAIYNHRKSARPIPNWLHKKERMIKKKNLTIECSSILILTPNTIFKTAFPL